MGGQETLVSTCPEDLPSLEESAGVCSFRFLGYEIGAIVCTLPFEGIHWGIIS